MKVNDLKIKLFADGADKDSMLELARKAVVQAIPNGSNLSQMTGRVTLAKAGLGLQATPFITGFTTNPTLMRKAGVTDYAAFAKDILSEIKDRPISFEVFSDEFHEMERQARIINSWADNVYVKIPITNTKRESAFNLVKKLAGEGIKQNVTAILSLNQVEHILPALGTKTPAIISVFAGRIADTGRDPMPIMKKALEMIKPYKNVELLWASPRELLNIVQANEIGCHIITATPDILKKLDFVGYDLEDFSLDTVKMFYDDGQKVGYKLYES